MVYEITISEVQSFGNLMAIHPGQPSKFFLSNKPKRHIDERGM